MESIEQIRQQAASWLSAINNQDEFDKTQFETWYQDNPKHRIIFHDLEEDWSLLSEINEEARIESPQSNSYSKIVNLKHFKNNRLLTSSIAASFILFTLIFTMFNKSPDSTAIEFASKLNAKYDIILEDNSVIDLNASSRIEVLYTDKQRLIKIVKGDATFNVAKDKSRPFIVQYKEHKFIALGTSFTVNTRPRIQLIVTEHTVSVETPRHNLNVQEGHGVEIDAHDQINSLDQADTHLGWTNKELIFDSMPLSDVISTIQPYLKEQIVIVNMGLSDQPVSGRFELKDPMLVLNMIAKGLNLSVKKKGNLLLVI